MYGYKLSLIARFRSFRSFRYFLKKNLKKCVIFDEKTNSNCEIMTNNKEEKKIIKETVPDYIEEKLKGAKKTFEKLSEKEENKTKNTYK
jgi:hypothetical protein